MILITTSYTYITHTLSLFPSVTSPYCRRAEGFSYFKHEIPKQQNTTDISINQSKTQHWQSSFCTSYISTRLVLNILNIHPPSTVFGHILVHAQELLRKSCNKKPVFENTDTVYRYNFGKTSSKYYHYTKFISFGLSNRVKTFPHVSFWFEDNPYDSFTFDPLMDG